MPIQFFRDRTVKHVAARLLRHAAAHSGEADRGRIKAALMTYGEICAPYSLDPRLQSGRLCWDLAELFIDRYEPVLGKRLMLPALLVNASTGLPGYYEDPEHGFWAKVYQLELTGVPANTPAADRWLDEQQRSLLRAARFLADAGELDVLEREARS
jgi:hypothetical protein